MITRFRRLADRLGAAPVWHPSRPPPTNRTEGAGDEATVRRAGRTRQWLSGFVRTFFPARDGRREITGTADGSVRLWSILPPALASDGVVNGVAFSHRQDVLAGTTMAAGYSDGKARLYRLTANGRLVSEGVPVRASASGYDETVAFSPDGRVLATGGDDGTVRLWNVADPARPRPLATVGGFASYVFSVAFSADGGLLAASSADRTIRLWPMTDPAHPVPLGGPVRGPANTVHSVAFGPHGHILAAGSADRSVWLWDMTDPHAPAVLATLTGPENYVYAVAFSPDGGTLAAGSADGTVRL